MQKFIRLYKSLTNTEANRKLKNNMHAISYAFGRDEDGIALGDIEAVLCECIFYNIYMRHSWKFSRIPENCRFHIPEEWHLGLASQL